MKIIAKTKKIILSLAAAAGFFPLFASAIATSYTTAPTFAQILTNVLNWLLSIFGILALIGFVVSGILYLTSAGDQDRIELAKKSATYAILGVIVGLSALIVIQVVNKMLSASSSQM